MQTTSTYPLWQQVSLATPERSGIIALAHGLTLSVWFFTLVVGYWWISDWFALRDLMESGYNSKQYYIYGFAIAIAGHLTLGVQAWASAPFEILSDWTGRLITLYCFLMLCLAPFSIVPKVSAVYSAATLVVVVLMWLFWSSNFRVLEKVLVITGDMLFVWLLALLRHNGLSGGFGGAIGGVNRNATATAALAAMVCALFSHRRGIRWIAFAGALFFAVIVSSRGSIVAMAAFVAVYYTLYSGTLRAAIAVTLGMIGCGVLFALSDQLHELVFEHIFHVHDVARGAGSGFTGRYDMWMQALEGFRKSPIIGYGFRSASMGDSDDIGGVHSGWIKVFVEGGVVGGSLIALTVAVETIRRLRVALRLRNMKPGEMPGIDLATSLHLNIVACATLCMISVLWVYEQLYINLGSAVSLVFFMVLLAPTYITTRGVTLRS